METQTKGLIFLILAIIAYVYYVLWLFVEPLIDPDYKIHDYFPDRKYSYMIPTMILVIVFTFGAAFLGMVMVTDVKKKRMQNVHSQ